jgi:hypothetical protein
MLRALIALLLLGCGVLGGLAVGGPSRAFACSIVAPSTTTIGFAVGKSPIIAIGRIADSAQREATFVVEENLQGSARGESFRVDNRGTYTAVACSPYEEPFREGYRFADGERYVMFLENESDGLWQVGYLGLAAFPAPANDDEKLRTDWYASPGGVFDLTLGDIRALVAQGDAPPLRAAGTTNASPDGNGQGRTSTAPKPNGDRRAIVWVLAVAGVLAAGAAASWGARRFRRDR